MWPFNEEIVARAIFNSSIPIVSAVGHETDYSISDFVADLRAPTPSAAAELVVPDIEEVVKKIDNLENRYRIGLKKKIQLMKLRYEKCINRRSYTDPLKRINEKLILLDILTKRNNVSVENIINNNKSRFAKMVTRLDTLSPLKTLARGYSIVEKEGKVINRYTDLEKDDKITIKFTDGKRNARVL